jgi:hypothetical protein
MSSFLNFNSMASQIGQQIYREARKKAYENGKPNKAKELADKMLNQFQSNILAAIDREERFNSAKEVQGSHIPSGGEWENF